MFLFTQLSNSFLLAVVLSLSTRPLVSGLGPGWSVEQRLWQIERRQTELNENVRRISTTLCENMDKVLALFANDAPMHRLPPRPRDYEGRMNFYAERGHWFQRLDEWRGLLSRDLGGLLSLAIPEQHGVVLVDVFGSLLTGLGTSESDVDVSVRLAPAVGESLIQWGHNLVEVLGERLKLLFRYSGVEDATVMVVAKAVVPLIKVAIPRRILTQHNEHTLLSTEQEFFRFDISISNFAAVHNSHWLRAQVESVPHSHLYFRPLMLRVKEFARQNNLDNTSRDHAVRSSSSAPFGVSSYGWALLVSFYLRRKSPGSGIFLFYRSGMFDGDLLRGFKAYYYAFNWEQDIISFPEPETTFLALIPPPPPQKKAATSSASSSDAVLVLLDPFVPNRNLLKYFLRNFSSGATKMSSCSHGGHGGAMFSGGPLQTWRAVFAPDTGHASALVSTRQEDEYRPAELRRAPSCLEGGNVPRPPALSAKRKSKKAKAKVGPPIVGRPVVDPPVVGPPVVGPPVVVVDYVREVTRGVDFRDVRVSWTTDWQIPFSELLGETKSWSQSVRKEFRLRGSPGATRGGEGPIHGGLLWALILDPSEGGFIVRLEVVREDLSVVSRGGSLFHDSISTLSARVTVRFGPTTFRSSAMLVPEEQEVHHTTTYTERRTNKDLEKRRSPPHMIWKSYASGFAKDVVVVNGRTEGHSKQIEQESQSSWEVDLEHWEVDPGRWIWTEQDLQTHR